MNEFEKVLSEMLDEYGQDPDRMKDTIIAKYGNEIRKQIASEIDTDILQDKYESFLVEKGNSGYEGRLISYRQGIEDVLKLIKVE